MRRSAALLAVPIVACLLAACANWEQAVDSVLAPPTPVPLPTQAPTPTPLPGEPALVAYDYVARDAGDGWMVGMAHLWLENPFQSLVPPVLPPRASSLYDVSDAYVETAEGKTYPAKVISDLEHEHSEGKIDLRNMPSLPPGFRCIQGLTQISSPEVRDQAWGGYTVEFRFAQAAHPTMVRFPSHPKWDINLAEAIRPEPALATDLAAASFQPIGALDNRVLLDQPGRLLITLGGCQLVHEGSGWAAYLAFTAQNRDKLDEASAIVPFPARAVAVRGQEFWYLDEMPTVAVGPGQEQQGQIKLFPFGPDEATHLVVYWPDGDYQVYTTADCGR